MRFYITNGRFTQRETAGADIFDMGDGAVKVTVPDGVTHIDDFAFLRCTALEEVTLPEGLRVIGQSAFGGRENLKKVTIPASVTEIRSMAFAGCKKLASLTLPHGLEKIGSSAFEGCVSLAAVELPKGLISLGGYAFENCKKLKSVVIPEGVTTLYTSTFSGCTALESVTLHDGLTKIEGDVFSGCKKLADEHGFFCWKGRLLEAFDRQAECIVIPEGVVQIGVRALADMRKLTAVKIPESCKAIDEGAFEGCVKLRELCLPDSVQSIGENAFADCKALASVRFPAGKCAVDDKAFAGTKKIAHVYVTRWDNAWMKKLPLPKNVLIHTDDVKAVPPTKRTQAILAFLADQRSLDTPDGAAYRAYIGENIVDLCSFALQQPEVLRAFMDARLIAPENIDAYLDAAESAEQKALLLDYLHRAFPAGAMAEARQEKEDELIRRQDEAAARRAARQSRKGVSGLEFAVNGGFDVMYSTLEELRLLLSLYHAHTVSRVSEKTDYLIVTDSTSEENIAAAEELGVEMITPKRFWELVGEEGPVAVIPGSRQEKYAVEHRIPCYSE